MGAEENQDWIFYGFTSSDDSAIYWAEEDPN